MLFKSLNQITSLNKSTISDISKFSTETSFDINKSSGKNTHYNAVLFTRPQMYNF
ncbi:hypothetical protein DDB_G0275175 [Dictyostelium discoideum AX4]|uniref:Uncharacterized protein n=1 Tax=Dictyostelium discoideum TaxID=44689 RepID=Q86I03_DICDI|nr:hypothetical protein DDB_G0275175 [Dictyostelium discoideum AX4]EAL69868.1 hypothetical protein DDB_G0275175 [Dictyostelium discoideum AX4]|eukprot:XP_643711.1 hypothetical protein DDB_G0275175 [Dictyostelium discoideum AX4]